MAFENLILEIENSVAVLYFNRPKALNALNKALLDELSIVLDEIENNQDIKVLVLTGAGEKAFVAGADISEIARMTPLQGKIFSSTGQKIFSRIENLPFPVIAAVNGFALGGGTEVALACDFIYASEKASFGLPEITLGIIPGFGGTQRLTKIVGTNMAKEMIFTGKIISASEAEKIGLVNKVFAPESLMDDVLKCAKSIVLKGRVSLRAAKESVESAQNVDILTGCRIETDAFAVCMTSPDAKEGTTAFLEKRKPLFTGTLES
ncbi:MAG: enoyl-CoA hydratase-related protein [Thermodesulfobacteriota bacterium]|nr:enoyl-CoA hydratase-related protein [Thermodesulfobacteriota bacterium]